jgi:hypothetical protein
MTDYGYGYGDAAPGNQDYGYGDASPEYGYGDAGPDRGIGYADAAPEDADHVHGEVMPEAAKVTEPRRPKRRCSVTKYSLVSNATEGSAEAEMGQQIQQAEMMQNFRNGGGARPSPPQPTSSDYSMASAETMLTDDGVTPNPESAVPVKKGKGKLSRLRRRLSVF